LILVQTLNSLNSGWLGDTLLNSK